MADNTTAPFTGSGDTTAEIATDEVDLGSGTAHVQYVKLAGGAYDDTAQIQSDGGAEANALRVTLADTGPGVDSAFLVDGSAVTQPVSAASLPLPAGAATAAKQLADGHNVVVTTAPTTAVTNAGLTELATAIVAHAATHAASAMGIGGVAVDLAESPTAVDKDQFSEAKMTRDGQMMVFPGHPNTVCAEYRTTAAAQTNDIVIAGPGAGSRLVITGIQTLVDNASTTDPDVRFGFGATVPTEPTSGATASTGMCPGGHPGIAAGSGVTAGYAGAAIATGGDNEPLRLTNTTNTAGDIRIYITYYVLNG